jgi:hypothetical protein
MQFEITEVTRQSVERCWLASYAMKAVPDSTHESSTATSGSMTRGFGTHSLRRTKVARLYRKTAYLRAV